MEQKFNRPPRQADCTPTLPSSPLVQRCPWARRSTCRWPPARGGTGSPRPRVTGPSARPAAGSAAASPRCGDGSGSWTAAQHIKGHSEDHSGGQCELPRQYMHWSGRLTDAQHSRWGQRGSVWTASSVHAVIWLFSSCTAQQVGMAGGQCTNCPVSTCNDATRARAKTVLIVASKWQYSV